MHTYPRIFKNPNWAKGHYGQIDKPGGFVRWHRSSGQFGESPIRESSIDQYLTFRPVGSWYEEINDTKPFLMRILSHWKATDAIS